MTYKPLICLDFDGVIHRYGNGWKGNTIVDDIPTSGALPWLRDAYLDGRTKVAIYSSRSKWPWGRWAMQRWLRKALIVEFGHQAGPHMDPLYIEILDWLRWPWFKPAAFITIDDRALTFSGSWPDYDLDTLLAFKPWNKRRTATEGG